MAAPRGRQRAEGASGVAARIGGSGLAAALIGIADAVMHSGADDPVGDKYAERQNQEPLHRYLQSAHASLTMSVSLVGTPSAFAP